MQFARHSRPVGLSRSERDTMILRHERRERMNIGDPERAVSVIGGALLVFAGLKRGTFTGLIGALVGAELVRRGITGHSFLYERLGVDTADRYEDPATRFFRRGIHVEEAVTIQRPREEVYQFWRNFENLPRFMDHLKSVEVLDDRTSRWVAKAPAGYGVEWTAEIINEEPGSLIAWRSLLGADVDNRGAVRFRDAPQGRGTEVKVTLEYIPPAGRLGAAIAGLFGEDPRRQIRDDLRRLRQILETGEVPTTRGQPSGQATYGRVTKGWTEPARTSAAGAYGSIGEAAAPPPAGAGPTDETGVNLRASTVTPEQSSPGGAEPRRPSESPQ